MSWWFQSFRTLVLTGFAYAAWRLLGTPLAICFGFALVVGEIWGEL